MYEITYNSGGNNWILQDQNKVLVGKSRVDEDPTDPINWDFQRPKNMSIDRFEAYQRALWSMVSDWFYHAEKLQHGKYL
jgi:hypothetical protein